MLVKCVDCGEEKDSSEFYKRSDSPNGLRKNCKKCHNKKTKDATKKYQSKESSKEKAKFVNELKSYYISKNKGNKSICESISKMSVDGNDKYSMIRNIPIVDIGGKKLITKITEDLIKLLSK